MKLTFKKLNKNAVLPAYAHAGDSGMDIRSIIDKTIEPRSFAQISTGIAANIPEGYEIQVRPRSGLQSKYGIVGAWGTVDSNYRGEIIVVLYNFNEEPYYVRPGDRIAQLVLAPVVYSEIEETDSLSATNRGADGLGSTGR